MFNALKVLQDATKSFFQKTLATLKYIESLLVHISHIPLLSDSQPGPAVPSLSPGAQTPETQHLDHPAPEPHPCPQVHHSRHDPRARDAVIVAHLDIIGTGPGCPDFLNLKGKRSPNFPF